MTDYIVHSKRSLRSGCRDCKAEGESADYQLYLGHDPNNSNGVYCVEHDTYGVLVVVQKHRATGVVSLHKCGEIPAETEAKAEVKAEAPQAEAPKPEDMAAAMAAMFAQFIPKAEVDTATVHSIVKEHVDKLTLPVTIIVQRPDEVEVKIENAHKALPALVGALTYEEHVALVGPAGSGKSTLAEQAAESLGLPFYALSLSPATTRSEILGYMDANGTYHRTLFREAFENGGVFHFDEVDNGHAQALTLVNAALANGKMAFPDGMVDRHRDFRIVASGNTAGTGGNRRYVRNQLDAAFLDRFTQLSVDYDEALESILALAQGLDSDTTRQVLEFVRHCRKAADDHQLLSVISPRASIGICRLLNAGWSVAEAVDARVRKSVSDDQWKKMTTGAPKISAPKAKAKAKAA